MAEPPAKRPKIVRGEDDYLPGNIVEIELRNFMTFDYLKCKPCSRLNLVIGPNGSGKSSVVCAIALGLGGDPSLLGRATSVGAYVKRGEDNGYIKISLRGETVEEHIIITRKISTQNNSEWLFNGKAVPKKEILAVTQRFNIQVNNLTQFLPQDRVCEFAKLTPVQLLKETEKAVGDPQLPIQHDALIQKSNDLKIIERSLERNGETLDQLKSLNAEQEKDVKRVRQREALLEKAKVMKKKLPWLKYDMKKAEYMKAKELENEAKNKLNEAARTLNDFKEPIEKQKRDKVALEAKCKKVGSLISDNAKRRLEIMEKETQLEVQAQGKYKEIQDLRKQEASRQQRILRAKEELAAAESELKNLTAYEPPTAEISKLRASILEIEDSERNMRQRKSDQERTLGQLKMSLQHCLDRLKDMESTKSKLLHALKNSGTEKIYEAYQWLQEHRSALNKEVYGPVLLEVNVSDRDHASYLEGHISYYMWKSFITQDSGDRDFLVKNLRPFDVPVLNFVGKSGHKEPIHLPEKLRALGIYSRLDQVFDAPDAVKEVMINQFGLEYSYIGTAETDQKADEVSKLGVLDFWTPDNHYRWSRSRYGNHVSGSVEPVGRSRLLLCGSDAGEIERLRSRKKDLEDRISDLEESLKPLQSDIRQIEDEASKLRKQREDIVNTINHHNRKKQEMVHRVDQRKKKLASLQEEDDLDTIVKKLADQAAGFNAERYKCALRVKELLGDAFSYKRSFADKHMASIEFDAKIREMEISLKEHEKFALQASLHLEYCKKEVEDHRRQLAAAKEQAESVTVITPELEKAFLEMPTTVEELEAAIQDNISQANSILFLNPNILAEYEDRQRQIEAIARKHEADKRELTRCLAEINALKEYWLPTLRNIVSQINETFGRNFEEMAVAGEVSLDEHGSDFDQYGILIKVKFRQAGQLQVLSAHHQSGGERSVSTILYLVSLQDLTNCPFRVVDEINQGMDPINERKMFQQLVRSASQPNTPQCFLLTPKLLPDLEYSEACSILNIMNGPWIEQPSKVWSSGGCWRSVTGLASTSRC
ncbi:structural maintenance of chromosomes protein 5 isoform X3 [Rhodamnia argentea]|uniref:Structural maintenance of chromosomes protein 5 n=1 Tax=Rhodamnia argentea TaxID=178133 RepID=A0ABM3HDA5_9MYRT|nr:structural maintenance of chromosomes protein 5 isoform X3 [Rhodamnia argentea]